MSWPPVFTGSIRFLLAGILLLAVLRFTRLLGVFQPLTPELRRQLWLRGGLSAGRLYRRLSTGRCGSRRRRTWRCISARRRCGRCCGRRRPRRNWASARRYGAALLALSGVVVLFWPALQDSGLEPARRISRSGVECVVGDVTAGRVRVLERAPRLASEVAAHSRCGWPASGCCRWD